MNKQRKEHLENLEKQIIRLEGARSATEPTKPEYKVICDNLAALYEERDKYLTPFLSKDEAKSIALHGAIAGGTALVLANIEQIHPITTKMFNVVTRGIFNRRA